MLSRRAQLLLSPLYTFAEAAYVLPVSEPSEHGRSSLRFRPQVLRCSLSGSISICVLLYFHFSRGDNWSTLDISDQKTDPSDRRPTNPRVNIVFTGYRFYSDFIFS